MLYVTQDARIKEIIDELQTEDYICKTVIVETPPVTQDLEQRLKQMPYLLMSTRSKLSQRGIEVTGIQGYHSLDLLTSERTTKKRVAVTYWAGETVKLRVGDPICRFYQIGDFMLDKQELEALTESGELDLGNNYKIVNEVGAIDVKPRNVKFVPHPDQPKVLTMEHLENNTYPLQASEVDSLTLTPNEFVVTETEPISLPEDVYGDIMVGADKDEPLHLWSPLIDPGFKGTLRLEFRSLSYATRVPLGVLRLFRNKK